MRREVARAQLALLLRSDGEEKDRPFGFRGRLLQKASNFQDRCNAGGIVHRAVVQGVPIDGSAGAFVRGLGRVAAPMAPARLRAAHRSAPDPKCEITGPGARAGPGAFTYTAIFPFRSRPASSSKPDSGIAIP